MRAGSTVDLTAFPVTDGEDAWAADEALERYLDSELPADRITVSSDGGGCLPVFDADGRVTAMGVGDPGSLIDCLHRLLARGRDLAAVLPAVTTNVAGLLRLTGKGRIAVGADADLVALAADGAVHDVIARGSWHLRGGKIVRRGTLEDAR